MRTVSMQAFIYPWRIDACALPIGGLLFCVLRLVIRESAVLCFLLRVVHACVLCVVRVAPAIQDPGQR